MELINNGMVHSVFVLLIMLFMKEIADFVHLLQFLMLIKQVAYVILLLKFLFQKEDYVKNVQLILIQMLIKLNVFVTKTMKKMKIIDVYKVAQLILRFVMENVLV